MVKKSKKQSYNSKITSTLYTYYTLKKRNPKNDRTPKYKKTIGIFIKPDFKAKYLASKKKIFMDDCFSTSGTHFFCLYFP